MYGKKFLGTQERNTRGKRAISVRAIEVLVYLGENMLLEIRRLRHLGLHCFPFNQSLL